MTVITRIVRRLGPLIAVLGLLVIMAAAVSLATPQIRTLPFRPLNTPSPASRGGDNGAATGLPSLPPTLAPGEVAVQRRVTVPAWLLYGTGVLCLLAAVAVVGALVWYLLGVLARRRARANDSIELVADPVVSASPARVLAALDASLIELDDLDTDPRRAVIACWVRLEQAAAAAGIAREPGDTASELVVRLLATHQVSPVVLADFSAVYLAARYGTHEVDQDMRTRARAALHQVRAELTLLDPVGPS